MLIPNQLIKVKVIGITLEHYRRLGYDVKPFDTIMVPPEHLTNGSKRKVELICDVCGKLISRPYKEYLKYHTNDCDTCNKCKDKKAKETCMERYGVETHMLVPEVQEKFKSIAHLKYGVDNVSQADAVKAKKIDTCVKNFGVTNPMLSDIVKRKVEKTNMEKYGCKNPNQNKEIRQKAELTNIKRYGVKNPNQNPTIKARAMKTMCEKSEVPTSSQQIKLYEIIKDRYPNAELNHPFSTCSLDVFVCINKIKLDIEYDGSYWHYDEQKDIRRDKFLQSNGFKTLRIRSGHMIPTEKELFDAINELIDTDKVFKEIILPDWKEADKNESLSDSTAV